tara:strand:- start:292 stop:498 length:207 start_codon:yes stop_codon:yes gene_type:complete
MTREEYNKNKHDTGSRGNEGNVGVGTSAPTGNVGAGSSAPPPSPPPPPARSGPIVSDERDAADYGHQH